MSNKELFLSLKFSIAVQEDVDNMEVHVPPGVPVKPKSLPPKRKKRGGIGRRRKKSPDFFLNAAAAAVVPDPSLPAVEVPAPCK